MWQFICRPASGVGDLLQVWQGPPPAPRAAPPHPGLPGGISQSNLFWQPAILPAREGVILAFPAQTPFKNDLERKAGGTVC